MEQSSEAAVVRSIEELVVGMKVEAMDRYGKWYTAKVTEKDVEEEEVVVHFDGWSSRYDEYVSIKSGRLRHISPEKLEQMEREKALKAKQSLKVGDRVQAKWEDGRMYFGKILKLLKDMALVLFDDGIEYTAPLSTVRKRRVDPSPSDKERGEGVVVVERRRRVIEKRVQKDSTSQQASASPPSSPLFTPKRIRSAKFLETDESSCTESDGEEEKRKRPRSDSSPISSDSELRPHHKRTRHSHKGIREPYKLRKQLQTRSPFFPVTETALLPARLKLSEKSSTSRGHSSGGEIVKEEEVEEEEEGVGEGDGGGDDGRGDGESYHREQHSGEALNESTESKKGDIAPVQSEAGTVQQPVDHIPSDLSPSPFPLARATDAILICNEKMPHLLHRREKSDPSSVAGPSGEEVQSKWIDRSSSLDVQTSDSSLDQTEKSSEGIPLEIEGMERALVPPSLPLLPKPPSFRSVSHNTPSSLSLSSSPSTSSPYPPTSTPAKQEGKRSMSDSAVPKSPGKMASVSGAGVSRRKTMSAVQGSSVNTRYRAQTAFENIMKGKEKGKQGKVAPKELVIVWDHNEFKCQHAGCGKSFRKESLLQSHEKHYHSTPSRGKKGKANGTGTKLPASSRTSSHSSPPPSSHPPLPPAQPIKLLHTPKSSPTASSLDALRSPQQGEECFLQSRSPPVTPQVSEQSPFADGKAKKKASKHKHAQKSPATSVAMGTTITASAGQTPGTSGISSVEHTRPHVSRQFKASAKKHGDKTASGKEYTSPSVPSGIAGFPSQAAVLVVAKDSAATEREVGEGLMRGFHPVKTVAADPVLTARGESVGVEGGAVEEVNIVQNQVESYHRHSRSSSVNSEGNEDDVVHCVCGDSTDEGFMIQCEQCLCWQHGDCVEITKEALPEKYICCFCTHPPGLRWSRKYQFDSQWYRDGTLPSLPGGPKFSNPDAMLKCHALLDQVYQLRKMSHSAKVKLQAASNPQHPYLRQWAKECASLDKEVLKNYLMVALQPITQEGEDNGDSSRGRDEGKMEEGRDVMKVPATTTEQNLQQRQVGKEEEEEEKEVKEKESGGGSLTNGNGVATKGDTALPSGKGNSHLPSTTVEHEVGDSLTPHLPSSRPVSSTCESTARDSTVDPQTLTLAPLPPLDRDERPEINAAKTSSKPCSPKAVEDVSGLKEEITSQSSSFDSITSELEFGSEFGVQELSVFAVRESGTTLKHPKSIKTVPETKHLASLPLPLPSSRPPLTSPGKLPMGSRSAFKPITLSPSKPTTGYSSGMRKSSSSSQLTSLLTSPITTQPQSIVNPPSSSTTPSYTSTDHSQTCPTTTLPSRESSPLPTPLPPMTQLSRLSLVPRVNSDPVYLETASSLLPTLQESSSTVKLKDFAEAFFHGDTTNWFQRMLLLDHIENVQDEIANWMEEMEKQLHDISDGEEEDSDMEDADSLLSNVQTTLNQLSAFQKEVLRSTD